MPDRRIAENTLFSFMRALEAGADGIEFDLRVSADQELIAVHDDRFSRIAGDLRRVKDLSIKDAATLTLRGSGNILSFKDITTQIPSPVLLDAEIKDPKAASLLISKLATSAALRERTIVSSFSICAIQEIREAFPDLRSIFLVRGWIAPGRRVRFWPKVFDLQPWAVGVRIASLNIRRSDWIRKNGLAVATYDERRTTRAVRRMHALQPDVAITYRPDLLMQLRISGQMR